MSEVLLQQIADRLAIMDLPARYMRALDRLDRDLMGDQFWDDAYLDYGIFTGGPEEFADFCMKALSDHAANHHMIGQNLIEIEGNEASGEVYFQAFHRVVDDPANPRDVVITGRYIDRYERRNGIWKFSYRSEVVDWAHDQPATDAFIQGSGNILGARKPDDWLYKCQPTRK